MTEIVTLKVDEIYQLVKEVFVSNELPEDQACVIAKNLILTECCGISTHGISMVPAHIHRLNNGGYNIKPKLSIEKSSHAYTVIDSDNAVGIYSADFCMEKAIIGAKEEGLHVVFTHNSNTYGAAFTYTKKAIDQGLIGVTFCNTPAAMAPWGGKSRLLGTNPIAVGIPGKVEGPILFDIATSIVAKSKIGLALKRGEKIPMGWALDVNGIATIDPLEAIKGTILPMAEYKGYGLALCLDILSGVLCGAAYADEVSKFYSDDLSPMNVGQTFIAIDPQNINSTDFYNEIDNYINKIHVNNKRRNVMYPGENKNIKLKKTLDQGIDINSALYNQLIKLIRTI